MLGMREDEVGESPPFLSWVWLQWGHDGIKRHLHSLHLPWNGREAPGGATFEWALGGSPCTRGSWRSPWPHSQVGEHRRVPARPAGAPPTGSVPAPACLLPSLAGCSPLGVLLPVPLGAWHSQRDQGDWQHSCQPGWAPARRPPPGPHFKTLSCPTYLHHPSPLAASGCS